MGAPLRRPIHPWNVTRAGAGVNQLGCRSSLEPAMQNSHNLSISLPPPPSAAEKEAFEAQCSPRTPSRPTATKADSSPRPGLKSPDTAPDPDFVGVDPSRRHLTQTHSRERSKSFFSNIKGSRTSSRPPKDTNKIQKQPPHPARNISSQVYLNPAVTGSTSDLALSNSTTAAASSKSTYCSRPPTSLSSNMPCSFLTFTG